MAGARGEACVAVYLPTSPLPQESLAQRPAYRNLAEAALQELVGAVLNATLWDGSAGAASGAAAGA